MSLRLRRALVVSLTLLVVAVFVGAPPASAVEPTAAVGMVAVQARGAALVVEVVGTCPAGGYAQLHATATQRRADGTLAQGTGFLEQVTCTGAPQTARMAVGASNPLRPAEPAKPFAVGPALISVDINLCQGACRLTRIERTVQATAVTVDDAGITSSAITGSLPATAELEAAGTRVTVRIPYRCAFRGGGGFEATLRQRTSPGGVTVGSAGGTATCTGLDQTGVLAFQVEAAAWTAGTAFMTISGAVSDSSSETGGGFVLYRTLTVA